MSTHRWRHVGSAVAIVGFYAVLAIVITWPVVTAPGDSIPIGREGVSTVPLLNTWTVWWNADRAAAGFRDYWQAPIFAPTRYAFAFSESQPTTLLVAPVVAVAGPVFAYNAYLLVSLTLNGLVANRLLRRVGSSWLPALMGGAVVAMLPILHWQVGVLQLTTLWGVLWVVDRLLVLRDGRPRLEPPDDSAGIDSLHDQTPQANPLRVRDAVLLGVAAAVCYAACNYFGLYLSVLLPLAFLPLIWGRWRSGKFWALLAGSVVVAGGLSSPILYAQFRAKTDYAWTREDALLFQLSAKPRDYANPYRPPLIEGPWETDPKRPLWTLGVGPGLYLLAGVGAVAGMLRTGLRRWTLFLVLFGGAAFALSLGLAWEVLDNGVSRIRVTQYDPIRGWLPYKSLMAIHPGLALARSPFRFAFFVQIAVGLLAAGALDGMWQVLKRIAARADSWRRTKVGAVGVLCVAGSGLYAALEVVPTRQDRCRPPSLDRAWIFWLRDHGDPARPVLCLPFPAGDTVADYERTAEFMSEQIGHQRAMLGGYSGFFPPEYLNLKANLSNFPEESVLDELRSRNVEYIVAADAASIERAASSPTLDLAFRDEDAKVNIYGFLPVSKADDRSDR